MASRRMPVDNLRALPVAALVSRVTFTAGAGARGNDARGIRVPTRAVARHGAASADERSHRPSNSNVSSCRPSRTTS